jgi:hypothetical protein
MNQKSVRAPPLFASDLVRTPPFLRSPVSGAAAKNFDITSSDLTKRLRQLPLLWTGVIAQDGNNRLHRKTSLLWAFHLLDHDKGVFRDRQQFRHPRPNLSHLDRITFFGIPEEEHNIAH